MTYPTVYLVWCEPAGMGYVGGTKNFRQRKNQHRSHLRKGAHPVPEMQAAWNAHGPDSFEWIVLETLIGGEHLGEAESRWIAKLRDGICNKGGDYYVWNKGMKMPPISEQERKNRSEAHLGRRLTEETKRKLSEAQKGRKRTKAQRFAMSLASTGNTNAKGAVRSEDYKNNRGKPVIVTAPDGTQTTYPRMTLAAETVGYERANMIRVLRTGGTVKRGPFAGWRFEYEPQP